MTTKKTKILIAEDEVYPEESSSSATAAKALLQNPIDLESLIAAIDDATVRNQHGHCQL